MALGGAQPTLRDDDTPGPLTRPSAPSGVPAKSKISRGGKAPGRLGGADARNLGVEPHQLLYAGTSGFSYTAWKGGFYPKTLAGARMLAYYADKLTGVELNGSFYRTPPETTLRRWEAETPPGFKFCMKANRGLTYSAEAFDKVGLARLFSERIAILGDRLGPVLLQFPPMRQKNIALLDSLLSALQRPAAAEFRHESWFDDETYAVLQHHGGALVVTDEAKWPRAPLVDLSSVAYFRLRRGYTSASLGPWIADIKSAVATHDEVHVYFKHDSASPALARRLLRLAGKESVLR